MAARFKIFDALTGINTSLSAQAVAEPMVRVAVCAERRILKQSERDTIRKRLFTLVFVLEVFIFQL